MGSPPPQIEVAPLDDMTNITLDFCMEEEDLDLPLLCLNTPPDECRSEEQSKETPIEATSTNNIFGFMLDPVEFFRSKTSLRYDLP